MKKSLKIIGLMLLIVAVFSVGVFAGNNMQAITAYLNYGITVEYNDVDQVMTDANGTRVYPVTYNGTTYLPVRAVANMLGVKVDWDGSTNHVLLGNSYVDYTAPVTPVTPTAPITSGVGYNTFKTAVFMGSSVSYQVVDMKITEVLKGSAADAYIMGAGYQMDKSDIDVATETYVLKYEITVPANLVETAKFYPLSPRVDIEDMVIGNTKYWSIANVRDMYNRNTGDVSKGNKRYGEIAFTVPAGYTNWTITLANKQDNVQICPAVSLSGSQF